jgi:hypothetical protein
MNVAQSLGLIGFGCLVGWLGLLLLLNLFGAADDMAEKAYRRTSWLRDVPPWKWFVPQDEREALRSVKLSQRPPAVAFTLIGLVLIMVGAVNLIEAIFG